jgi:hypothetical protein
MAMVAQTNVAMSSKVIGVARGDFRRVLMTFTV